MGANLTVPDATILHYEHNVKASQESGKSKILHYEFNVAGGVVPKNQITFERDAIRSHGFFDRNT